MRWNVIRLGILCGLACCAGCAGARDWAVGSRTSAPPRPEIAGHRELATHAEAPVSSPAPVRSLPRTASTTHNTIASASSVTMRESSAATTAPQESRQPSPHLPSTPSNVPRSGSLVKQGTPVNRSTDKATIQQASHAPASTENHEQPIVGTIEIQGRTYRLELVDGTDNAHPDLIATADATLVPVPTDPEDVDHRLDPNVVPLNLPTALSMVGGQHPAVGAARWRVQEAYAQLDQAEVLWLPTLQAGFSFHRHDGNYQASNGDIVDVNRNSFQYGMGAGAVGAGTTPRPGLVAQFHLADAIFQPEIAEKTAWARGHAANGVVNQQLLTTAQAYLQLLRAEQDRVILSESHDRTANLAKLTSDFAATGQGLYADADRLQTELVLVESRQSETREQVEVTSARLCQTLGMDASRQIVPLDPTVVPLQMVTGSSNRAALIQTGLANRPELKEAQALVAAACEQHARQKYAPFVPSILLGASTGGFGGGLGSSLGDVDGRYDLDALMTWEVRNLGFGEQAARRQAEAQYQQARFESIRVMDQVAREVAEAHAQVTHRAERIELTRKAIEAAQKSYDRNLGRIRDGQGLPLEVLQSVQALEAAQRAYLNAVTEYNEAQFQLQWALGWPVTALAYSESSKP